MWISRKKYNKLVEELDRSTHQNEQWLYELTELSKDWCEQYKQIKQLKQDNKFMSNLLIGDAE